MNIDTANYDIVWTGSTWRSYPAPTVAAGRKTAEVRTLADQILDALRDGPPRTMSGLQDITHRGYHSVRDVVLELVAAGRVERMDIGRGVTRYRVTR
jgi:hypothetical protein